MTLRQLHRAHLLTVPFENLDIHRGYRIQLDPAHLFEKIVVQRRGGFCYELNGLFAALLVSLGFPVQLLSAQVIRADGSPGPDYDHLLLKVDLDQPWLADVGFGDSFRDPLHLTPQHCQSHAGGCFRFQQTGSVWILARRGAAGSWKHLFQFRLDPCQWSDFTAMCEYHQTSSESLFTRHRLCTLATANGRITLTEKHLLITQGSHQQEIRLANASAFTEALWLHFQIWFPPT